MTLHLEFEKSMIRTIFLLNNPITFHLVLALSLCSSQSALYYYVQIELGSYLEQQSFTSLSTDFPVAWSFVTNLFPYSFRSDVESY